MNTKKWTCKDGSKIRIKDMTDDHLVNAIRILERFHHQDLSSAYNMMDLFRGEMALQHCEDGIAQMEEDGCDHPLYEDLQEEALKRKLDV